MSAIIEYTCVTIGQLRKCIPFVQPYTITAFSCLPKSTNQADHDHLFKFGWDAHSTIYSVTIKMLGKCPLAWHRKNLVDSKHRPVYPISLNNKDTIHLSSPVCRPVFQGSRSITPTFKPLNINRTLVGNEVVDHSDVVGASPVDVAPTTSSFFIKHMASMDWANNTSKALWYLIIAWNGFIDFFNPMTLQWANNTGFLFAENKVFKKVSHLCSTVNDCTIGIFVEYYWITRVVIRLGVYSPHSWAQLVENC